MEFVDINLTPDGSVVETNDKIALIDADTIAYTACSHCEKAIDLLPREFYSDEEWANLTKNGEPDIDGRVYESNFDEVLSYARFKLNKILTMTGCKDCELHFTDGKFSFRYFIYPDYKANRKPIHRPMFLFELKLKLCELYKGFIHTSIEADDAVAYLARKYPEKYIICAVDKDILNAIEGKHFNYYESAHYNIDMKWQETDSETARLFPYRQAMIGDRSDNIIGLDRIGPKKAEAMIPNGIRDPMNQLIEAFKLNGRTAEEAKLNFELCYMGDEDLCDELEWEVFAEAKKSKANKLKVGALLVNKNGKILARAHNHSLVSDLPCEDENNKTYSYVVHAEHAVIMEALSIGIKTDEMTLVITHSPCCECIKHIALSGISEVIYYKEYKPIPEWAYNLGIKFISKEKD